MDTERHSFASRRRNHNDGATSEGVAPSFQNMKTKIVISRNVAGKQACEYVGDDADEAIKAGKKASQAGLEAFLFVKPFHAKRWPASVEVKQKSK